MHDDYVYFPVLTPLFLSLMDGWDLLREQSRDGDQTLHDQSRSTRARMEQHFGGLVIVFRIKTYCSD